MTVVIAYHELSDARSPLAIPPKLFSAHLAALRACGAEILTAGELGDALRRGAVPKRAAVLTFDDGFAAAVREARPLLAEANMRATFFCVAGHLGGASDWPSRAPDAPVGALASAEELTELARDGHEIGSHGWSHAPLDGDVDLERELVRAKTTLEAATGAEVTTFAYPYGASPTPVALTVVEKTYAAAFGTTPGRVRNSSRWSHLPRVDAHYLRDPRLLRRVVDGSLDAYLELRRLGARARRVVSRPWVAA